MIDVFIANDMTSYKLGKSDGIIFKNVEKKDLSVFKKLAIKYNKQINIITYKDIEEPQEESVVDKRKIKKIFITNGKETIKITPDKLHEYIFKGYHQGRK